MTKPEQRRLETHPQTGAAQIVEIRERVEEIRVPITATSGAPKKYALFAGLTDEQLLAYGVPQEWLAAVKEADEDALLELADHLPGEAAEALLELATGGQPKQSLALPHVDPFHHPDARRRFRLLSDADELRAALDAIGLRLYAALQFGKPKLLDEALLRDRMQTAAQSVPGHKFRCHGRHSNGQVACMVGVVVID